MKKIMILAALAAFVGAGCRSIKVEDYGEEALTGKDGQPLVDSNGTVQKVRKGYKVYHNGHWLRTDADALKGSIGLDGTMNFEASGLKSSVSEEFNKSMMTYMNAITDIARLAAAAYNPATTGVTTASSKQQAATANATQAETAQANQSNATTTQDCPDCAPTNCVNGVCGPSTLKPTNR